ncbi:MAG: OmpA family protein [Chitinophagaceae bacterium]|nr:OmpA family protein [Chitinophagaceae bacterium]
MLKQIFLFVLCSVVLFSCVSSKKYKASQVRYEELNKEYARLQSDLRNCEEFSARQKANMQTELDALRKENAFLKENNTNVLNQLKDLSVLSATQAESVKKSLENLSSKDAYIQDLQSAMSRKDSLNMALVMNLKSALNDVNDKDINVQVEKGVVYINISDKLLFRSGSAVVSESAMTVLGKVAQVLNAHPTLDILVEGHTDSVPIKNNCILDNWDLSTKRATSITRILQNDYKIDPVRLTAGGRAEYIPVVSNDTEEGRAANRRTRIIILPQLDQFFKLLERKG